METETTETNGVVSADETLTLNVEVQNAVQHVIRLRKDSGRALDPAKSDLQIASIIDTALTQDRIKRGWSLAVRTLEHGGKRDGKPAYEVHGKAPATIKNYVELIARCETKRLRNSMGLEFDNLCASIDTKAQAAANRWCVDSVDGERYVPKDQQEVTYDESELVGYAPFNLPTDPEAWLSKDRKGKGAFDHLFGLDSHVNLVKSVLELADQTNFRKRVNIALIGRPGCGKSDICETLANLLGQESVFKLDGTSTTMAGAQKELAEREEMPRVMVIEEIEKAPEASLPWLLSIMDMRGEIRKVTARGNILRDARMIVICTVNDEETFRKINFGALYSRFTRKIHFKRPSRDLLWKILDREVKSVGGSESWIDPALDFASEIDTTDPREIIAIALCGQDKLLTGEYQAMLRDTMSESGRADD